MKSEPKRFSISIPEDLFRRLQETKKAYYAEKSQKEMMIDLIERGLNQPGCIGVEKFHKNQNTNLSEENNEIEKR